jgi:quinol monooxygenase YgiN
MTIYALLDLKIKPESLAEAPAVLGRVLAETRAFDGCEGVQVVVDLADETHFTAIERWRDVDADAAYRAWRAGEGKTVELGALLAGPPSLVKYVASDI